MNFHKIDKKILYIKLIFNFRILFFNYLNMYQTCEFYFFFNTFFI